MRRWRFKFVPRPHFKMLNTWSPIIFINRGSKILNKKGAGTIRWLKWKLSQFETYDLKEFNLMLLRNSTGSYWAMLTCCKVCVELQWASLMHSVASAPGFNTVTSPVETGLFGFSQLHQRSQSIFILHGYLLSQQHLIKRLKETANLPKFVERRSTQAGL